MDLQKQIEENRLFAFKCYVRDWKKQDENTVKSDGGVFSYTTKRGIVKKFQAVSNARNSSFKVQGFYFAELK